MNQAIKTQNHVQEVNSQKLDISQIESVLIRGDISGLSAEQKVIYYKNLCDSLGLNPLTKPFDYLTLGGKQVLYAKKDCTDQLRFVHKVSLSKLEKELIDDIYVVTAYAKLPDGREDSSTGAVSVAGLRGDAKANAIMKAETKAKRRVTLSICGLGMLDETEVETIPEARQTKDFDQASSVQGGIGSKGQTSNDNRKPTEAQLKRLYAITKSQNVAAEQVKAYVLDRYKIESSKDLSISQYNELCDLIQSGGSLEIQKNEVEIDPLGEENLEGEPEDLSSMEDVEPQEGMQDSTNNQVPWAKYRQK